MKTLNSFFWIDVDIIKNQITSSFTTLQYKTSETFFLLVTCPQASASLFQNFSSLIKNNALVP